MTARTPAARRQLTTKDLERVFGVTAMTLYLWRRGTATRSKLRTAPKKRGERSVAYYEEDVIAWAKRHDVPLAVHPSKIKAPAARKQPGPRASTTGVRRAA